MRAVLDTNLTVTDCRDPDDNKFLALALSGRADLILSGDYDLLVLKPWRSIPILGPSAYLAQYPGRLRFDPHPPTLER